MAKKKVNFLGEVEVREEDKQSEPFAGLLFKIGRDQLSLRLIKKDGIKISDQGRAQYDFLAYLSWTQAMTALVGSEVVVEMDDKKYVVKRNIAPEDKKTVACAMIRAERQIKIKKNTLTPCEEGVDDVWTGMIFSVGEWRFVHYYGRIAFLNKEMVDLLLASSLHREFSARLFPGVKRKISLTRKCAECEAAMETAQTSDKKPPALAIIR